MVSEHVNMILLIASAVVNQFFYDWYIVIYKEKSFSSKILVNDE